jgi:hypothetical protein
MCGDQPAKFRRHRPTASLVGLLGRLPTRRAVRFQHHLQPHRNIRNPRKARSENAFKINGMELLTEIPAVNRFGEYSARENGFRPHGRTRSQQPYRYKPRKQREIPATCRSGERVLSGSWLGREDSNLRYTVPKTVALPLGHAPSEVGFMGGAGRPQGGKAGQVSGCCLARRSKAISSAISAGMRSSSIMFGPSDGA